MRDDLASATQGWRMTPNALDVPFHCQLELARISDSTTAGRPWGGRTCAIACATMVLHYFGVCDDMSEVLDVAVARNALDRERGWLHGQLVEALQSFGLVAYRRNWRLLDGREDEYLTGRAWTAHTRRELDVVRAQMLREGIWTLRDMLDAGVPAAVSIYRPTGDRDSIGHQVVLVAADDDEVIFHDPAQADGAFSRSDHESFFGNWKGTAIIGERPRGQSDQPQNMLKAL